MSVSGANRPLIITGGQFHPARNEARKRGAYIPSTYRHNKPVSRQGNRKSDVKKKAILQQTNDRISQIIEEVAASDLKQENQRRTNIETTENAKEKNGALTINLYMHPDGNVSTTPGRQDNSDKRLNSVQVNRREIPVNQTDNGLSVALSGPSTTPLIPNRLEYSRQSVDSSVSPRSQTFVQNKNVSHLAGLDEFSEEELDAELTRNLSPPMQNFTQRNSVDRPPANCVSDTSFNNQPRNSFQGGSIPLVSQGPTLAYVPTGQRYNGNAIFLPVSVPVSGVVPNLGQSDNKFPLNTQLELNSLNGNVGPPVVPEGINHRAGIQAPVGETPLYYSQANHSNQQLVNTGAAPAGEIIVRSQQVAQAVNTREVQSGYLLPGEDMPTLQDPRLPQDRYQTGASNMSNELYPGAQAARVRTDHLVSHAQHAQDVISASQRQNFTAQAPHMTNTSQVPVDNYNAATKSHTFVTGGKNHPAEDLQNLSAKHFLERSNKYQNAQEQEYAFQERPSHAKAQNHGLSYIHVTSGRSSPCESSQGEIYAHGRKSSSSSGTQFLIRPRRKDKGIGTSTVAEDKTYGYISGKQSKQRRQSENAGTQTIDFTNTATQTSGSETQTKKNTATQSGDIIGVTTVEKGVGTVTTQGVAIQTEENVSPKPKETDTRTQATNTDKEMCTASTQFEPADFQNDRSLSHDSGITGPKSLTTSSTQYSIEDMGDMGPKVNKGSTKQQRKNPSALSGIPEEKYYQSENVQKRIRDILESEDKPLSVEEEAQLYPMQEESYVFYLQTENGGLVGPLQLVVDDVQLGLPGMNMPDGTAPPKQGLSNRQTGSHSLNEFSSRSHSMLTVNIDSEIQDAEDENLYITKHGKLTFVDLAGSEKLRDTLSSEHQMESNNINKSLLVLGNCIAALGDAKRKQGHIPYRDSKLTKLLADSLGGNGVTLMIACISPSSYNGAESMNTLRYANRAKRIKNKPTVKMDPREKLIMSLKREIKILRQENHYLRQQIPGWTSEKTSLADTNGDEKDAEDTKLEFPVKPKGQLQKENDAKFLELLEKKQEEGGNDKGLYAMLQEYMIENEVLRNENSDLHQVKDRSRREQQVLARENEKLQRKLEEVGRERSLANTPLSIHSLGSTVSGRSGVFYQDRPMGSPTHGWGFQEPYIDHRGSWSREMGRQPLPNDLPPPPEGYQPSPRHSMNNGYTIPAGNVTPRKTPPAHLAYPSKPPHRLPPDQGRHHQGYPAAQSKETSYVNRYHQQQQYYQAMPPPMDSQGYYYDQGYFPEAPGPGSYRERPDWNDPNHSQGKKGPGKSNGPPPAAGPRSSGNESIEDLNDRLRNELLDLQGQIKQQNQVPSPTANAPEKGPQLKRNNSKKNPPPKAQQVKPNQTTNQQAANNEAPALKPYNGDNRSVDRQQPGSQIPVAHSKPSPAQRQSKVNAKQQSTNKR